MDLLFNIPKIKRRETADEFSPMAKRSVALGNFDE